jgi:DNA-binding NarL/FixJ family response regulator
MYPSPPGESRDRLNRDKTARRVLVVDDHRAVREGVEGLLRRATGLVVVGSARDGREAIDLANELKPDVVLMDVSMPRLGGAEATRLLAQRADPPAVVAFTGSAGLAREALLAGAVACVFKDAPASELIAALEGAARV